MISIVTALILAFILGLFVLRETHAIWHMTSPNAIATNCTMNLVFCGNPFAEAIILIFAIIVIGVLLSSFTHSGFG
jgi:hypothetical protein